MCEAELPQETLLLMAIESDDKEAPNVRVEPPRTDAEKNAALSRSARTKG